MGLLIFMTKSLEARRLFKVSAELVVWCSIHGALAHGLWYTARQEGQNLACCTVVSAVFPGTCFSYGRVSH